MLDFSKNNLSSICLLSLILLSSLVNCPWYWHFTVLTVFSFAFFCPTRLDATISWMEGAYKDELILPSISNLSFYKWLHLTLHNFTYFPRKLLIMIWAYGSHHVCSFINDESLMKFLLFSTGTSAGAETATYMDHGWSCHHCRSWTRNQKKRK